MIGGGEAMTLWERFLEFPFYQNALMAGAAIGTACAMLSVFVVQRGMAFIGQGISHAAFGGVGAALLLEVALPAFGRPLLRDGVIALFCLATALSMGRIGRQRRIGEDSAIGIMLVVAMALGVTLLDLRGEWTRQLAERGVPALRSGYTPSFHDILFGNILSVSRGEVWLACGVAAAVVLWIALTLRGLVFYAVDEEAAAICGVPTDYLHYGLLTAVAVTIVVAMRLLGVILVSALLVLPGTISGFWSRSVGGVLAGAAICSLGGILGGLIAAMELRVLSTGPVIVLVLGAMFLLSWLLRARR